MKIGGKIVCISTFVVDIEFITNIPNIKEALYCIYQNRYYWFEVCSHLSRTRVRTISMQSCFGLYRGLEIFRSHKELQITVGPESSGRVLNALNQSLDPWDIDPQELKSIYRSPPSLLSLKESYSMLHTGIKVIDFFAPYFKKLQKENQYLLELEKGVEKEQNYMIL